MDNKYKIGDLITDKAGLFKVISINDETYQLKVIAGRTEGTVYTVEQQKVETVTVPYDINNPLTKVVNDGVCICSCWCCSKELALGDPCIHYDDEVYCCEDCMLEDLGFEEGNIDENDLDDSKTRVVPLFELTKEQLDVINEKDIKGDN